MKKEVPRDKFYLKSLHQEIDFFDRKISYLENFTQFDTDAERDAARHKLVTKRASLAETAKILVADGVEFNHSELPRSFQAAEAADQKPPSSTVLPAAQPPLAV